MSEYVRARAREAAERSGPAVGNSAFIEGYLASHEQLPPWGLVRDAVDAALHDINSDHDLSPADIGYITDAVLALIRGGQS